MDSFLERISSIFSDPVFTGFGLVALLFAATFALVRVLQFAAASLIKDSLGRYRARKSIAFGGYLLLIVLLLSLFSDSLGQVSVAIGVAGAGIAFALQEVIASVAGWLAISFANFYKPGDRVQLGGIKGDVIDVGVLRTTLMEIGDWVGSDLYNGRVVRIANSFVFKEPVFNYSGEFPFLWDEIKLPIHYESDLSLAQSAIEDAVSATVEDFTKHSRATWEKFKIKYLIADPQISPMVTVAATDNWVEFTARYIVDYRHRRVTRDAIIRRLIKEIKGSDGKIRLASTIMEVNLSTRPHSGEEQDENPI